MRVEIISTNWLYDIITSNSIESGISPISLFGYYHSIERPCVNMSSICCALYASYCIHPAIISELHNCPMMTADLYAATMSDDGTQLLYCTAAVQPPSCWCRAVLQYDDTWTCWPDAGCASPALIPSRKLSSPRSVQRWCDVLLEHNIQFGMLRPRCVLVAPLTLMRSCVQTYGSCHDRLHVKCHEQNTSCRSKAKVVGTRRSASPMCRH